MVQIPAYATLRRAGFSRLPSQLSDKKLLQYDVLFLQVTIKLASHPERRPELLEGRSEGSESTALTCLEMSIVQILRSLSQIFLEQNALSG